MTGSAALADSVIEDWRNAPLDGADRALCAYAEKLTLAPASVTRDDVEGLRASGLADAAISDAVQVIAYFNYINRVADGLGCELEPEMPARPGSSVDSP